MTFLNSIVLFFLIFVKLTEFAGAFADSLALFLPWRLGPRRGLDGWMRQFFWHPIGEIWKLPNFCPYLHEFNGFFSTFLLQL